jgi:predicted metal-dependent enzyme (double-stranded beta helix superfamily)
MMNSEAWLRVIPHSNNTVLAAASLPTISPRQAMLAEIAQAIRAGGRRIDRTISNILADTVSEPDLLDGLTIASSTQRYSRHLLEAGHGYCVLALVWLPGQMSPVHSHRAFCALGVHRGTLTETHFHPAEPTEGAAPRLRLTDCRQLQPGATSHGPAHDPQAHRMANLGVEPAISIHVYGAAFDRLGAELNEVWAD